MSDAPLIVSTSTLAGFAAVVLAKALMPGRNMAYSGVAHNLPGPRQPALTPAPDRRLRRRRDFGYLPVPKAPACGAGGAVYQTRDRARPMANGKDHQYLLPAGLKDGLPPDAAFEAAMVERLMACFAAWGYERVKPPLIEFEDALLSGMGAAMASETFRLMDPVSQRMMGVRADMTPQVGRIAASRLKGAPRPLRLSYAGQVLRVKGEQMRPERQIGQAGVELIGIASAAADAEAVLLAAEALQQLGVTQLVVDLNAPTLAVVATCANPASPIRRRSSPRSTARTPPAVKELGGKLAPTLGAADECRRCAAGGVGSLGCRLH